MSAITREQAMTDALLDPNARDGAARGEAARAMPCAAIEHLVVIAGGKGQRLSAIAGNLPKALVKIGGRPVLQHQLELARDAGVCDVTILAGHGGCAVRMFAQDLQPAGLAVRTLIEPEPRGSAGALLARLDSLPEHFFALYGDLMLDVDLRRLGRAHLAHGADLTAVVHPNDHPQDSDLLETDRDGWVTALHPYPHPADGTFTNLVNAALYVVRRDALREHAAQAMKVRSRVDFSHDLLPALIAKGARVLGYRTPEYIKDMGTPARLARVEADWHAGLIRRKAPRDGYPAVLLDRDGTLNVDREFIRSPAQIELLPEAGPALKALRESGFRLAILTNQPVVARGEATEDDVAAIHRRLEWKLGEAGAYVDAIYVCPHHPDSGFAGERRELKFECACRKPATGLFERARRELDIDPARAWMIGDTTRDIEMAKRAGIKSILVRTGMAGRDGLFDCTPDHVAENLAGAALFIREHSAPSGSAR
jgi:histidinol-phosphate phosphatase family protein